MQSVLAKKIILRARQGNFKWLNTAKLEMRIPGHTVAIVSGEPLGVFDQEISIQVSDVDLVKIFQTLPENTCLEIVLTPSSGFPQEDVIFDLLIVTKASIEIRLILENLLILIFFAGSVANSIVGLVL